MELEGVKEMLRTNSKQAKQNLQAYIMTAWNIDGEARSWKATASAVWSDFIRCAYSSEYERKQNRAQAFAGWLQGLPKGLGDFYLHEAVRDLGDILEETEEERNRFTEDQASEKLATLIYCKVEREANR